jgi:AraC-like DNA-binding protein/mannose-6-phosphate isomerase-like protein (cupin superfamily)
VLTPLTLQGACHPRDPAAAHLIGSGAGFTVSGRMRAATPAIDASWQEMLERFPPDKADAPLVLSTDTHEGNTPLWGHRDFSSIFLVERGCGTHEIDGRRYAVSRGDVYVMGAPSVHAFLQCQSLVVHGIHFPLSIFDAQVWRRLAEVPGFESLVIGGPIGRRLHLTPFAYADAARDLAQLWSEWRSPTPAAGLLVPSLFLNLLVRLARRASGEAPPPLHPPSRTPYREEIVAAAVRTIDLNAHRPLRVHELAAAAYVSPDRFTELFAQVMGRTPRDYIRHVRLEHAKTLLAMTTLPISEIARSTGLGTHVNFCRAFHAAVGMTPRAFRRSNA